MICPYCHEITFIGFKTKNKRLHLNCSCEIPRKATPKAFEIRLIKRQTAEEKLRIIK